MAIYNKFFYNETVRKYVIAFGSLFSNINVVRKNAARVEIGREVVPLTYSPKEKFVQRLMQDATNNNRIAIKLPHIAFEITDYQYDPERKISSKRKISQLNGDGSRSFMYTPVPYNYIFTMYIFAKTQEEGLQIIEQITPFFAPDYNLTLKMTDLDHHFQDTPIILNSLSSDDTYDGEFEQRRSIIWTLTFTLKGYMYGPIRTGKTVFQSEIKLIVDDAPVTIPTVSQISGTLLQSNNTNDELDSILFSAVDIASPDQPVITINQGAVHILQGNANDPDIDLTTGTINVLMRLSLSDPNPIEFDGYVTDSQRFGVVFPPSIPTGTYILNINFNDQTSTTILVEGVAQVG